MKKNIIIVIFDKKQIRSFLEPNAFGKVIENTGPLTRIIFTNCVKPNFIEDRISITLSKPPQILFRMGSLLGNSLLWHKRFQTISHLRRAVLSFSSKKIRKENHYHIYLDENAMSEFARYLVKILSIKFFYTTLKLIRSFFIRRFLKRAFLDLRIDLDNYYAAFVPYSGHLSPFFDDFVDFFKSQGLKTIGVQENWDHLSSKAFIDCEPDVFCVWGEQSAGHLQNVHSLFNTKVLITGSPRMQPYYSSSIEFSHFYNLPRNLAERISRPYILLTGSGDGIDDEFILNEIYEALDYSQNFQIIYRPHLHARRAISHHCIAKFIAGGLIIDDHKSSREVFYHVGLVMNAELVINQFSTILVETLLCNKKILLPGFLDRNVTYDWIDACNSWHHFIGISTFPNVFISKSKENFKRDFKSALDSQSQDSSKSSNWIAAKLDVSSKYLESLSM